VRAVVIERPGVIEKPGLTSVQDIPEDFRPTPYPVIRRHELAGGVVDVRAWRGIKIQVLPGG
jgi:hypothetical protein